nr:MAG TPA: hypothetical protein [Caudoviricetes sp.]
MILNMERKIVLYIKWFCANIFTNLQIIKIIIKICIFIIEILQIISKFYSRSTKRSS